MALRILNPEYANFINMEVEVYNSVGSKLFTNFVSEGEKIDISTLPVGSYHIKIKPDGGSTEIETLIKMK